MVAARPRPIVEMREWTARLFTVEALRVEDGFRLRPTDVVIAPFVKSSTTWTQQIAHTLRTRGDMNFDDISRVVPWIEFGPVLGTALDVEQVAEPRAFKSHLSWDEVPKGGRYVVVREPSAVAVSMYKFKETASAGRRPTLGPASRVTMPAS